mgnify:CR=1 FL=1
MKTTATLIQQALEQKAIDSMIPIGRGQHDSIRTEPHLRTEDGESAQ